MNNQKSRSAELVKRTAIYIAPAAYCDSIDMDEAVEKCRAYVRRKKDLKLMRIYRDKKVTVMGGTVGQTKKRRSTLGVVGNDAWKQLLTDTETSAVEVIVVYAARTVAPTISGLASMISTYFIPCNIRFIDVEAEFDTADGNVESYIKKKTSEYRSNFKRRPYQSYEKRGE